MSSCYKLFLVCIRHRTNLRTKSNRDTLLLLTNARNPEQRSSITSKSEIEQEEQHKQAPEAYDLSQLCRCNIEKPIE
eukprot:2084662-Amphidinium_carterae.1